MSRQVNRLAIVAGAAVAALTLTGVAGSRPVAWRIVWRIVAQQSASGGALATASVSHTIDNPSLLAVRLKGDVSDGSVIVSCVKSYNVSSYSRSYGSPGLYRLTVPAGADSCDVLASAGSFNGLSVAAQILTGTYVKTAAPKSYPVNRTAVRAGCQGAYQHVPGAHGPIHYRYTRTSGTCWFKVKSKGYEFVTMIVITKPQSCTYVLKVTVTHNGTVVDREPAKHVHSCQ